MSAPTISLNEDQLRELSSMLWNYRAGLERVEFLLEAQLLFAGTARDDRLGLIADMLNETAMAMGELDLHRELLLGDEANGAEGVPNLGRLCDEADEPWATVLRDQHRWFTATVDRIGHLIAQSRMTMDTTLDLITQMTSTVAGSPVSGYDSHGQTVRSHTPSLLFEGQA